ncbi:MAG TPA: RluA family pseudouridine synthase [Actinomycetota bacterium]|nr:RluA family pseudouridine synthase [Actinomycetota bacterium]
MTSLFDVSFVPEEAEVGERIDLVLARRTGVTRALARRALESGSVLVARERVKPSHRLVAGEKVEGRIEVEPEALPEAEDIPVDIRYEDEHVLVVSKPAGLVVHPVRSQTGGTLVNALMGLGKPLGMLDPKRPGIVHRLDKDTSGLVLVAKDDATQLRLREDLKARRIERRYYALVRGVPPGSGTVEAPIGRHATRRTLMAVVSGGRPAITHYEVLQSTDQLALLDVKLETGRTHQIRVHLSHIGHPVLGDRVYGGVGELSRSLGLDRPFLHAYRLVFPRGESKRIDVSDPLPDPLRELLERVPLPTAT